MLRKLRRRAASGPEYALLIALIAVVALGSIVSLGTEVSRVLGRTAEASYDSVADGPVWVTPPGSLGAIAQTVPFQFQLEATDPQGRPLTYGLKSGSLPDGITLSASGLLSGTVVGNSGLWNFVVEATNDAGKSAAQGFALTIDGAPLPFFFPDATNLVPGSAVVSAAITPGGFATAQPVTVSGPSNPKLSIAGADLDSFSGTLRPGETLALRATAPPGENETETVAVQIGPTSGSWTLKTGDSTPDPFGFGTTDNADTLVELVSSAVAPTGYSLPVSVSVTGAGNPLVSIDNGPFAATGTLHPGQTIQVKATTPATQNSAATVRVFAGPTRGDWTIRTGDNTPEPFTLSSGPAGVTAGGIEITAPETTPSGYTVPNLPWTVTGGLASVDGGPFASSGTISPG